MINLREGELIDILPDEFSGQPQVKGISYAIKQAYADYTVHEDMLLLYDFVDKAPEFVLDLMMAELRVKYHDQNLSEAIKRDLIKNAMLITLRDGTNWATERMIEIIYGEGWITEWYDYEGTPNHFKIDIVPRKTKDWSIILSVLDSVKRKTARLDSIRMILSMDQDVSAGVVALETMMREADVDMTTEGNYYINESEEMLTDEQGNLLFD